jgi:hypothetical protein
MSTVSAFRELAQFLIAKRESTTREQLERGRFGNRTRVLITRIASALRLTLHETNMMLLLADLTGSTGSTVNPLALALAMELKRPALAARVAGLIRRQEVRFLCLTLKS